MTYPARIATKIAAEQPTPEQREAFAAYRAALAKAESNEQIIARLRTTREMECRGVTAAYANGEFRDALPNDWEAFTAELRRVQRHYDAQIASLTPKATVPDHVSEERDPVYQSGNVSLRYWGRV